jgi:hypothetical protein
MEWKPSDRWFQPTMEGRSNLIMDKSEMRDKQYTNIEKAIQMWHSEDIRNSWRHNRGFFWQKGKS